MKAILLVASMLLVAASGSNPASLYDCPSSCNDSPNCMCAETAPPGGLSPKDTPQFIVLTNDDSVSSVTYPVIRGITDKHKNNNGCVMPATWFVQTQYTDPKLIQALYMDNHEIATHTKTHPTLPSAEEIIGARTWLNEVAKVPLEKIKGFRAPFLEHDTAQRQILQDAGFTYDSSITDSFGDNGISPSEDKKVWPFTMDYGIPIDCSVGTGICSPDERHPGLWEFPMWNIQDDNGIVIGSMDPVGDNLEQYKREFERNYNGARTPLGIYMHAGLLMAWPEHQDQLNEFLEWALTHENVWLVTISEILRWMKNPVPASQYEWNCSPPTDMTIPGGKLCFEPGSGCQQGVWDDAKCKCACQNQGNPKANGYCPNSDGVCLVEKTYDSKSQTYSCPGDASSGSDTASPSPPSSSPATDDTNSTAVTFGFYISGSTVELVQGATGVDICVAVARVALERSTDCQVTTVDVAGESRLYVEVTIKSVKPDSARLALQSAAQYGALAASLQAAGVQYAALGEQYVPSPAPQEPQAPAPAGAEEQGGEEGGSSGANVGAIVGGVVGGTVALVLAVVTAVLVVKHRKQKKRAAGSGAPSHVPSSKFEQGVGVVNPVSVLAGFHGAHSTGYNASPRSNVTPRHLSHQNSPSHMSVSMQS